MKMLTWNTKFARGTSAAIAYAVRIAADVVFLQEAQPIGFWTGSLIGGAVPGRNWGSWVMVRSGILREVSIPDYAGWVAGAQWLRGGDDDPIYLFSIHSPTASKDERRHSYVMEATEIVRAVCEATPSNGLLVIGGDFNFKSLGERRPSESIQSEKAELQTLQEFRKQGLSIVWRDTHPQQDLAQTLRWSNAPAKPFHCDGFLIRGFARANVTCDIVSSEGESSFSDHNPVVMQLPEDA